MYEYSGRTPYLWYSKRENAFRSNLQDNYTRTTDIDSSTVTGKAQQCSSEDNECDKGTQHIDTRPIAS